MKDIKTEIERYTKNNYLKKEIIERLRRDGFDISQINDEMSLQMEKAEDRIVMNMLYFFPSFLYLSLLVLVSIFGIFSAENILVKTLSFIALTGLIMVSYQYYKELKNSFIAVSILMYVGIAFLLVAAATRLAFEFKIPFVNYFVMVFGALYLYFFAKENLWMYKSMKK